MQLITNQSGPTMTSREIAELVESRHDSVKRTIERLALSQTIAQPPMVVEQMADELGRLRNVAVYAVNKRDSYVVVAQLSPEFTARLVDRWQELENGAAPKIPQSFAEALQLAADQAKRIEDQARQIEAAQPAIEFVDRYVTATTGSKKFREVAKLLKAKENEFWSFLEGEKIMYRLRKRQMPYANHTDAGRFEITAGVTAEGHAFNTVLFTPKGIEWVAGEWAKYQLRGAA